MYLEERNDFFVQRMRVLMNGNRREATNFIVAEVAMNDIETYRRDYIQEKDFRKSSNISQIRIPSSLYIRCKISNNYLREVFVKCRKEIGAHLIVSNKGILRVVYCDLDIDSKPQVSDPHPIYEVYPCFVRSKGKNTLLMGLRYTSILDDGYRSFSKHEDKLTPSYGVFDLLEDFLRPSNIKKGIDRDMFPVWSEHYAIYLCSGARLIVEDDRLEDKVNRTGFHRNRALYQSGSLVIFSAELRLQLNRFIIRDESGAEIREKIESIDWRTCLKEGYIRPEDHLFQGWAKARGLRDKREQVIFLGHNYSKQNSNSWKLTITKTEQLGQYVAILAEPERARIVDIQDWDWGMAEVYWRHTSERLFDRVVFPYKRGVHEQSGHFRGRPPVVKGDNPYFWEKKILGIGLNLNSWTLTPKDLKPSSPLIPPYYEQITDLVEWVQPYAPPLHPPVLESGEYLYLPYKVHPQYVLGQLAIINECVYKIKYREGVDEYEWSHPKRVNEYTNKQFSHYMRLGNDYQVYTRVDANIIGKKTLFYFQFFSSDLNVLNKINDESKKTKSNPLPNKYHFR